MIRPGGSERLFNQLEDADWALTTALCRCERQPSTANDALRDRAQERFDRLKAEYKNLPEENDAHATGPLAEPGVTGGTPHPAAAPKDDPCDRLRAAKRPVPEAAGR